MAIATSYHPLLWDTAIHPWRTLTSAWKIQSISSKAGGIYSYKRADDDVDNNGEWYFIGKKHDNANEGDVSALTPRSWLRRISRRDMGLWRYIRIQ
jgi:hypothetical protein